MFRSRVSSLWFALSACAALSACGSEDDDGESQEITGWLGETEHMKAAGEVGGRTLVLDVEGDAAKDLDVLYCERNYVTGAIEKIELKHNFEFDGEDSELEVSFVGFDFTKMPSGPVPVGGANEDAPTGDKINVELKVEILKDGTEINDAAASGMFTLELLSGTPGEDGLIPDGQGQFAGYLEAVLDSGSDFQLSFTAGCGANDVE